jgi:hypothetical protein
MMRVIVIAAGLTALLAAGVPAAGAQTSARPAVGPERQFTPPPRVEKTLPNDWKYTLSYQKYYSSDMVCYEGRGVPVDIELLNRRDDIAVGIDPLITRALDVLKSGTQREATSRR